MEMKIVLYGAIIFIIAMMLGSILTSIQKDKTISLKDEEITSLKYSMESFKEDYKNCLDEKSSLILDYKTQLENKQNTIDLYKIQCGINISECVEEYLYKGEPKFDYTYGYWYKCLSKTCGKLESSYPILMIKRNGIYEQATTVMGKTCVDAYYELMNDKCIYENQTTVRPMNSTEECKLVW